jgi:hypothetical protein
MRPTARNIEFFLNDSCYAVGDTTPYAAPSTGVFVGNSPEGRGREAALCQRDRKSLLATPDKNDGAQEASGIRVALSLVSFFWRSKRKKLACQCENWFLNGRRNSGTTIKYNTQKLNSATPVNN